MKTFFECLGKSVRSVIGLIVVICSFAFLFILLWKEIPKPNESIINVAAGLVLAALGAVVAYYFGSSKDKSDKEKAEIQKAI